jgi:hypothetical protein
VVEDLRDAVGTLPKLDGLARLTDNDESTGSHDMGEKPTPFFPLIAQAYPQDVKKGRSRREKVSSSGHFYESGRQDLNLRPLGPEPSALPG